MNLVNLDSTTRAHMSAEVQRDIDDGVLYLSDRLSEVGLADYPQLLLDAVAKGTPASLAAELASHGRLNASELSHSKKGKPIVKDVPFDAAETLADGEFNRFYMRGLCVRALDEGVDAVQVYRAKAVEHPRSSSEQRIGEYVGAEALLDDLRNSIGVNTALKLPNGPNSGLSVQLPA